MTKPYTQNELRQFDRITKKLSDPDGYTRIQARFAVKKFIAEHGEPKCDAMFAVLQARDAKNGPAPA